MERVKIETTQNVLIEHDIANVGDRLLALVLDFIFLFVYSLIITLIYQILRKIFGGDLIVVVIVLQIPFYFYNLASNLIFHGQTPGKKILRIKVVKLDGSAPSLGSYLIRWVLRLVDIWFSFGVVALITVIANGKGQRLGDIAAKTTVIKENKKTFFKHSIYKDLTPNYKLVFPEVEKLTEQDINIINTVLKAYVLNRKEAVTKLLFRAANEIKTKTGIESKLPPKIFLETLIKDYNKINELVIKKN